MEKNERREEKKLELPQRYQKRVKSWQGFGREGKLKASVIVVTYHIKEEDLKMTLDSLANQTTAGFEVIVIDNGNNWDVNNLVSGCQPVSHYLKLKKNYGLNIGRNVGSNLAQGQVLIFLDDDGLPRKDFVEGHLRAHQEEGAVAVRGKILPRNQGNIFNSIPGHYDLGDKPFPHLLDTEGNSSVDREIFLKLSGVNEELAGAGGYEGVDLSYRIVKATGDKNKVIYYPGAVIYHDYSPNLSSYLKKQWRHQEYSQKLKKENPGLFDFSQNYQLVQSGDRRLKASLLDRTKLKLISLAKRITVGTHSILKGR
jgi:GT2 family glycosyltransferase